MKSVNHEPVSAESAVMLAKTGQMELATARRVFAVGGTLFGRPRQLFPAVAPGVPTEAAGIAVGAFPGRPV